MEPKTEPNVAADWPSEAAAPDDEAAAELLVVVPVLLLVLVAEAPELEAPELEATDADDVAELEADDDADEPDAAPNTPPVTSLGALLEPTLEAALL